MNTRKQICPKRTLYGQNGPFLPLFDRFLKLGGSIWTITVLDEQSIPLRCSGHPTSLYFEKKFPHKIGPWKFRANGHFGPNGALLGPRGPRKGRDALSKPAQSLPCHHVEDAGKSTCGSFPVEVLRENLERNPPLLPQSWDCAQKLSFHQRACIGLLKGS